MTKRRAQLPAGMTPRLLSRDQAAAYCGISVSHFETHVARHVGGIKLGGRILWDRAAIDRWLDGLSSGLGTFGPDQFIEALGDGRQPRPVARRGRAQ
ncbi:MAG: helix-turn-helix transcriptional regulator [Alphaproteobacteria bacterium]